MAITAGCARAVLEKGRTSDVRTNRKTGSHAAVGVRSRGFGPRRTERELSWSCACGDRSSPPPPERAPRRCCGDRFPARGRYSRNRRRRPSRRHRRRRPTPPPPTPSPATPRRRQALPSSPLTLSRRTPPRHGSRHASDAVKLGGASVASRLREVGGSRRRRARRRDACAPRRRDRQEVAVPLRTARRLPRGRVPARPAEIPEARSWA